MADGSVASENSGYILLTSCIAALGGLLFGFDSGVINGTVKGLQIALQSDSVAHASSTMFSIARARSSAGRLEENRVPPVAVANSCASAIMLEGEPVPVIGETMTRFCTAIRMACVTESRSSASRRSG